MVGPYSGLPYHQTCELKHQRWGSVVKEECLFNFPLYHLFNRDDILAVFSTKSDYPVRPPNEADVFYR